MNVPMLVALGCAVVAVVVAAVLGMKLRERTAQLKTARADLQRFAPITDVEAQAAALTTDLAKATAERDAFVAADQRRRVELNTQYQDARKVYDRLRAEVSSLEENIEDMSFGLYKPHYGFDASEKYKTELALIYDKKKGMIRDGRAASCATEWTVGGSKAEGTRMTKKNIKIMLRAFNGEVDAAVAKVAWNNVTRMEERIRKAFDAINETGTSNMIAISNEYLDFCLEELRLSYEYERKKYEEKEEQRRLREEMREEEKALREAERAEQEAAAEEKRYEKALAKARAEVEKARGDEMEAANAKVAELANRLAEAHEMMERAKSMAQQTRKGNVYIISNIGSFGDHTYKIGMTRRLKPQDRVDELSDASVPFDFDVHAMIPSDDAPTLEAAFHRHFEERRLNLINSRREFFSVTLDEIEAFARSMKLPVEFTKVAEAREYRESLAMREQRRLEAERAAGTPPAAPENVVEVFPKDLLASV